MKSASWSSASFQVGPPQASYRDLFIQSPDTLLLLSLFFFFLVAREIYSLTLRRFFLPVLPTSRKLYLLVLVSFISLLLLALFFRIPSSVKH